MWSGHLLERTLVLPFVVPSRRAPLTAVLVATLVAGAVVLTPAVVAAAAQPGRGAAPATSSKADPRTPAAPKAGKYIVILRGEATATYLGGVPGQQRALGSTRRFDARSTAARSFAAYLGRRQQQVAAAAGVTPFASYTLATNGFAATLSSAQAAALTADPRVDRLVPNEIVHVADTTTSTGYLGLEGQNGVWASVGGVANAGRGIVVGVVDTGIAPENPSFAGTALGTDDGSAPYRAGTDIVFHKSDGSDFRGTCQTGTQFTAADCTTKVIGARYFVDGFGTANIGGTGVGEYLSPRDGTSHGSHTSSTAAGDPDVPARGAHISGVTPAAKIAVYKACWSGPSPATETDDGCATADLLSAIDAAVHDNVDVINYSIGAGAAQTTDSVTDQAFMRAAAAGIFVAAAGGNAGPDASTLDNASPWITTVAASTIPAPEATIELGDGTRALGASLSVPAGAGTSGAFVQAVDVAAPGATDPALCAPNSLSPTKAAHKIVLCDRGTYDRLAKSAEVKRAGGAGMVLVNPTADSTDLDDHTVPTVHVDAQYFAALHAYAAKAGASATLRAGNTSGIASAPTPQVAGFSSRGPVEADGSDLVKPDVAAPGVNILAAEANAQGSAPNWGYMSGTSMASPHVAGLGALYLGQHPNATPAEVKSALMTTATDTVDADGAPVHDPFAQGSGQVHPASYLHPGLVFLNGLNDWNGYLEGIGEDRGVAATDGSDLNLASIGIGSLPGNQTVTRTVTSTGAGTFTAHVDGLAGVTATVAPATLSFTAAGQAKTFTVSFTRTDAPLGEFSTGTLTWTSGTTTVRSAIAVRPVAFDAPKQVSGSGTSGSAPFRVDVGDDATVDLTAEGLGRGLRTDAAGAVGSTQRYGVTVPDGSTFLRVSLDAADNTADLDLAVYRRNPGGQLTEVARSATGSADEQVDVDGVTGGNYVVDVLVYAAGDDHAGQQQYAVTSYVVDPNAADGSFTTAPQSLVGKVGDHPTVTATWQNLQPGAYVGVVRFGDTGISTVVTIDAGADVPVAPGTPQLQLVTDGGWVGTGVDLGITASGLTPGQTYTASIDSGPALHSGAATSRGTIDWYVTMTAAVASGPHVLHLTGTGAELSQPFKVTPVTVTDGYGSPQIAFTGKPYARESVNYSGNGRLRLQIKGLHNGKVYLDEVRTVSTPAALQGFQVDSSTVPVLPGELVGTATVVLPDGSDGPSFTVPSFLAESSAPGTMTITGTAKDADVVRLAVTNHAGTSFNPMVRYYGCDHRQVVANGYLADGTSTQTWNLTGFTRVDIVDEYGNRLATHLNKAAHRCDEARISIAQNYWATVSAIPTGSHGYDSTHPITVAVSNRYAAYSAGFDVTVGEGTHRSPGKELHYEQIPTPPVTAPGPVITRSIAVRAGRPVYASSLWEVHNPINGIQYIALAWVDIPALSVATLTAPAITAGHPHLVGRRVVGSVLRVEPGTWRPAGTTLAVHWLRDGKAIAHATSARYRLTHADAGHRIAARVTATLDGARTITRVTGSVVVLRTFARITRPRLVGSPRVGHLLTVVIGRWRPAARLDVRWYRDARVIHAAHGTHYRLRAIDRGHRITVAVTGRRAGYATVRRTTSAVRVR